MTWTNLAIPLFHFPLPSPFLSLIIIIFCGVLCFFALVSLLLSLIFSSSPQSDSFYFLSLFLFLLSSVSYFPYFLYHSYIFLIFLLFLSFIVFSSFHFSSSLSLFSYFCSVSLSLHALPLFLLSPLYLIHLSTHSTPHLFHMYLLTHRLHHIYSYNDNIIVLLYKKFSVWFCSCNEICFGLAEWKYLLKNYFPCLCKNLSPFILQYVFPIVLT